jgi:hypothetical protein
MGLLTLLTDPKNFKFYNGGQGYTGDGSVPNLKNIPYGKDRIYQGSSNQPYIQTPIPEKTNTLSVFNNDFIWRGGIEAPLSSVQDVQRLTKMFADTKTPSGLFFITKQEVLSRSAVRTQTSPNGINGGIYSPLNTLAQAGVVAFGGHLNKQGLNPFAQTGAYSVNDNLYGVKVKPTQDPKENRLAQLYYLSSQNLESRPLANTGIILNNGINVLSYSGGPGSTVGVGTTNIRYAPDSQTFLTRKQTTFNLNSFNVNYYQTGNNRSNTWVYNSQILDEQESVSIKPTLSPPSQDFRATIRGRFPEASRLGPTGAVSGQLAYSLNYNIEENQTIEGRVNLGNPGARANKSYARYDDGVTDLDGKSIYGVKNITNFGSFKSGLDVINSMPVYRSENVISDDAKNDLVKFRIAIIDNDSPAFKTFIHFRAFLDTVTDSYNANWNGFQYLGRGEQFYTYNGFTRQMSLSWTVAAQSKEELIPMYKKLNYLASSLTPSYSPNGYMRGNLAQLTIGGYVYEQPGIITGFDYTMDENTPWEIGVGTEGTGRSKEDGTVKELAHIIKVSGFNFIPIHRFRPEIQDLGFQQLTSFANEKTEATGFVRPGSYGYQRYISIANGGGDQNSNYNYEDTNKAAAGFIGPVRP